jgi:hypothetical protein
MERTLPDVVALGGRRLHEGAARLRIAHGQIAARNSGDSGVCPAATPAGQVRPSLPVTTQ